jgi:hypothetical protein
MQYRISHDWMPAPAIEDTMKKAKNISTDRLNNSPVPERGVSARCCGRRV